MSCARSLPVTPAPDNPTPVQHYMIRGGDAQSSDGLTGSSDYFGVASHGTATTHLDALCHIFVDGEMYNGYDMREVRTDGAQKNSIMAGQDGIVSRGVLLDVPGLRGAEWLEPSDRITAEDLSAAEARARRIGSGRRHPPRRHGGGMRAWKRRAPGTRGMRGWPVSTPIASPGCTSVASRSLAATASPTRCPAESRAGRCLCIRIAIVAMGIHLIDNMQLGRLLAACRVHDRWAFQFVLAPLRLERGTASPVNPLAIF